MRIVSLLAATIVALAAPAGAAEKATRFWNLTSATVSELRLAPAGTDRFGENQCLNDADQSVVHDERLKITGVASGVYDAKIGFPTGRACKVKSVSIEAGNVFSIEDKDLVECSK